MKQHIPGPWKTQILRTGFRVTGPSGLTVAQVGTDADARLIAAAPRLLETAKLALLLLGNLRLTYADQVSVDNLAYAIDQATGGQVTWKP